MSQRGPALCVVCCHPLCINLNCHARSITVNRTMSLRPEKLQALGFVPVSREHKEHSQLLSVGGPARIKIKTHANLTIKIRIYGGALPAGNPQTLRCFLNRDAALDGVVVTTAHDATCVAALPMPNEARPDEIVHVWCYAQRTMCGERQMRSMNDNCTIGAKQANVMRWGFLAVPVSRLRDTGMFGGSLCDVDFVSVASCDMWLDDKQLQGRAAMLQDTLKVGRQVQVFSYPGHSLAFDAQVVYMHETHPLLKETNITEIGHRVFSTISTSVGQMPMWAFPYEAYCAMRSEVPPKDGVRHLLGLLRAAEFFAGFSVTNKVTPAQAGELLNELATLRSRACCYVLDSSLRDDGKEYSLDEWTFITDNPVRNLVAYDCEEGSCDGIATLALLTAPALQSEISKHPGLQLLRTLQLQYTPVMAIVTLRMMGTDRHSYHAMVFNLDAKWLDKHIERSGGAALFEQGGPFNSNTTRPPVAMEFTMYSTGCWQFGNENKSSGRLFHNSQLSKPLPSNPKAPADTVQQAKLYGHVHSLFTPTLVDTHGICQLICTYRGKLGVPIKAMMDTVPNADIKFIPLRLPEQRTLSSLDAQLNHMPRMLPFEPSTTSENKNEPINASNLTFDAVYRKADWTDVAGIQDAVGQHIASLNTNSQISVSNVDLGSGMQLVRVRA